VYDGNEWLLIDIGYEETVDEIVEMIRQMDFPLSQCKYADRHARRRRSHSGAGQGQAVARPGGRRPPRPPGPLEKGTAQDLRRDRRPGHSTWTMPPSSSTINDRRRGHDQVGDATGSLAHAGAHRQPAWPSAGRTCSSAATTSIATAAWARSTRTTAATFPTSSNRSKRIRDSDVEWLLPSHGPIFRKDNALLDATIARLEGYQHMADFGTCAVDWPLMDEWEDEIAQGKLPT
jgi:hydroxyacylglutathione hydrolase